MTKWWTSLTKGRRPEWMTWSFFIALLLFAMHVHEPWFDEIQAWFIAKDAPWHDLLWVHSRITKGTHHFFIYFWLSPPVWG